MTLERYGNLSRTIPAMGLGVALAFLAYIGVPVQACTIFVLTDANQALFCNNEDWSNPKTRIWFVPAGKDYYGCAYVGFDNGWAQGGLNTEGLAFDWVAGYQEAWGPDSNLPTPRGNPSQRMLESCATVEEAIAFYRSHWEPSFSYAKILVADRTGASVIIGAGDSRLQVERANHSRGFGYGGQTLDQLLAKTPETTAASGFRILQACLQQGQYATKYSCVYDLTSGDVFLQPCSAGQAEVKLNLAAELKKGGHYYDLPQIHQQLAQAPRPLLSNMRRFLMDEYKPIPDKEPKVTAHLRAMEQDMYDGTMHAEDYTADVWKELAPEQTRLRADTKRLGNLVSFTLVDRGKEDGLRSYRYRMDFEKVTVLQHVVFDKQNKVALSESEDAVWKPRSGDGPAIIGDCHLYGKTVRLLDRRTVGPSYRPVGSALNGTSICPKLRRANVLWRSVEAHSDRSVSWVVSSRHAARLDPGGY